MAGAERIRLDKPASRHLPLIVVDGLIFQFGDKGGIARVWHCLLKEWSRMSFGDCLLVLDRDGSAPKFEGIQYSIAKAFNSVHSGQESFELEEFCRKNTARLFLSTFYTTPLEMPSVMLVHDLIPELFSGVDWKWCQEKKYCTVHADGYVAMSNNTAKDLRNCYPCATDAPVCVSHGAVAQEFQPQAPDVVNDFKHRFGISNRYFLCVGTRSEHKNQQLFFQAFSKLTDQQGIAIVCCGGDPELEEELSRHVGDAQVHMVSLNDHDLSAAYAGAIALVYPSRYEGFGLPPLEAMACGCPVITCAKGSIPEVVGEAALYVGEDDREAMTQALIDIQRPGMRDGLIQRGLKRSQLFSWKKSAETMAEFLLSESQRSSIKLNERSASANRCWRELRAFERSQTRASAQVSHLLLLPQLRKHMDNTPSVMMEWEALQNSWIKARSP